MKRALIFGAGNIGRGFIGQLCAQSGYEVTFVDVDERLLARLNETGSYPLETVFNEDLRRDEIAPVRALHAGDSAAVDEAVAAADIAATAVGVRALDAVAQCLARGLDRRAEAGRPLDVLLCENLKDAARIMREKVAGTATPQSADFVAARVGFVDTVIGRMVPPLRAEDAERDPALIRVEPYCELPVDRRGFRADVPAIQGMVAEDNFALYTARKLYIHNCGHALLAYEGYRLGYEYGWQTMGDERALALLRGGWQEAARGIVARYGADPGWLREHQRDLDTRFRNRALGDTVFRLGRDPVRKLGSTDRLVAPARLALEAGVTPTHLARGIALALRFDHPEDPVAVGLQRRLHDEGLPAVLQAVCGLSPGDPLVDPIRRAWEAL